MLKKLPKRGTKVEDLVCIKCGKTLKECPPSQCLDEDCPNKVKGANDGSSEED